MRKDRIGLFCVLIFKNFHINYIFFYLFYHFLCWHLYKCLLMNDNLDIIIVSCFLYCFCNFRQYVLFLVVLYWCNCFFYSIHIYNIYYQIFRINIFLYDLILDIFLASIIKSFFPIVNINFVFVFFLTSIVTIFIFRFL